VVELKLYGHIPSFEVKVWNKDIDGGLNEE
jgi:hypothetical protein